MSGFACEISAWHYGLIGGLVTLVASGATHYVRHATNDYLYGALMGLSIVVMLLIPAFKKRLIEGNYLPGLIFCHCERRCKRHEGPRRGLARGAIPSLQSGDCFASLAVTW